jgi:hypothetical protein
VAGALALGNSGAHALPATLKKRNSGRSRSVPGIDGMMIEFKCADHAFENASVRSAGARLAQTHGAH